MVQQNFPPICKLSFVFQIIGSRFSETESKPLSNSDILKKAASMTLEQASPESAKSFLNQKQKLPNLKGIISQD